MTEIYIDEDTKAFIPYLCIVIGLSKIKVDFQKILNSAIELAKASQEDAATFLDFNNKEIYLFYLSFRIMIQNYSAYYGDADSSTLFVYQDFALHERLSNETFLDIRNKAASVLLNMDLTILQKVAVLTGFQLISKSGSSNANYGTAIQLQAFRKNAWDYLTDQLYFAEKGIHIKETAKIMVEQWKLKLLNDFLGHLNAINNAATTAYEKLDQRYAELLSLSVNKIHFEFDKARRKAIRKSAKNLKIGIAAMVITACIAPHVSALIGATAQVSALTGFEALLASLAIDSVTSAVIFTGTEAVLKNDYKGFHKKFSEQVAIEFSSRLTASLVASKSPGQIAKGSTEAIKVSATTSAVKNALQAIFKSGRIDDALKAALLGGISGAVAEKLVAEFQSFNVDSGLDDLTRRALEDGLHAGVQSAIFSAGKKITGFDAHGWLMDILVAALASYLASNAQLGVENFTEMMSGDNTHDIKSISVQQQSAKSSTAEITIADSQSLQSQKLSSNSIINGPRFFNTKKGPNTNKYKSWPKIKENKNVENEDLANENKKNYSVRVGCLFGKSFNILIEVKPLFRGDTSEFKEVFSRGFTSRGTNTDLLLHAMPLRGNNYTSDSAYIATSLSKEISVEYPLNNPPGIKHSFLYEIHSKRPTINITEKLTPLYEQGQINIDYEYFEHIIREQERAFLYKIFHNEIKGGWVIDFKRRIIDPKYPETVQIVRYLRDEFIPNPNYIPPYYLEQQLWNKARPLGHALTAVGLVLDGTSLYGEYQISKESGDYSNTYREGSRIVGGWTGAYTMGALSAELALVSCAPLTPLGSAACGIVSGIVGSGIGYYGGSTIATQVYDINSESFKNVINQPERKAVYGSIKETQKRYNDWKPTTFSTRFWKTSMEQGLDELETERYLIDGNIALFHRK